MKLLNPKLPPNTVQAIKLKAIVLDWAGTTVDFGSLAPARTLQRVFANAGIQLTDAEVRRDMGLPKRDHIQKIFALPKVVEAWRALSGKAPVENDVNDVYQRFIPAQLSCLAEYSALIPGVLDAVKHFRQRGLKIGSTTGYTRSMLDLLAQKAAQAGYQPDCSLSPEDVGCGRPAPFMLYECAVRLQIYPLASVVKVGDTPADIEEGLNAGTWSVGVAGTGNGIGLSYDEFMALPPNQRESRLAAACAELRNAGAHYVIDTLADLDVVINDIDAHLASANSSRQSAAT
jgi:phosphonoacetaldehyde hydrolase